jgi:hypothetical protein
MRTAAGLRATSRCAHARACTALALALALAAPVASLGGVRGCSARGSRARARPIRAATRSGVRARGAATPQHKQVNAGHIIACIARAR